VVNAYLRLGSLTHDAEQRAHLERAQALFDALPADVRTRTQALAIEGALWHARALEHLRAKDYPKARDAYSNELRAAEAVWRASPDDLSASRNVSLACKQLGAVLEMLKLRADARALYDRALALDRARLERDPAGSVWRLDLSFSLGSIGALLQTAGDLDGALAHYQQAVELRRAVVAAEPKDDFARVSLARGYQRLATIEGRRGRIAESLGWHYEAAALYRAQLRAHPERDQAWRDYAVAGFGSVSASLDLLEAHQGPFPVKRAHLARLESMIADLMATQARWREERRAGQLAPSAEDLGLVGNRLQNLIRRR
jgi:tetratricopeptide (TPR) repeat protein